MELIRRAEGFLQVLRRLKACRRYDHIEGRLAGILIIINFVEQ